MSVDLRFERERKQSAGRQGKDKVLKALARHFMIESVRSRYSYNFDWLGSPIIQYPQDVVAMQELIWRVKPDLIIECGIARGGSIIFYASMLELLGGKRRVVGVDIDIRKHNREEIEKHKFFRRITLIEGSSVDPRVVRRVQGIAKKYKKVLVVLDSSHSHEHVLRELEAYAPLVSKGSYCVVFDTIIAVIPEKFYEPRPWNRRRNPATAARVFLKQNKNFRPDTTVDDRLLISVTPRGYLKRIR